MLVESRAADILYTDAISGVHANFLRPSLVAAGLDPEKLTAHGSLDVDSEVKAWKTVWSAGHGVGAIDDLPSVADLAARLCADYERAMARAAADPFAAKLRSRV
jgi:nitronate monooxygenase